MARKIILQTSVRLDSVGVRIDSRLYISRLGTARETRTSVSRRSPRSIRNSVRNSIGSERLLERLSRKTAEFPAEASRRSATRRGHRFDRLSAGAVFANLAILAGLRLVDGRHDGCGFGRRLPVRFGVPHRSVPDHRVSDDDELPRHRDDEDLEGFPASSAALRSPPEPRST